VSSYRVALTSSAEKELHRLPTKMVARIMLRLDIWGRLFGLRAAKNSGAAIRNGEFVLGITE
jgi:hypothetical protein